MAAVAEQLGPFWLVAKLIGASYLGYMAFKAFWSAWSGARPKPVFPTGSKRGWVATYIAGVAMPLSNPKPIVFYLTLVPAFVPIEAITAWSYAAMVAIMIILAIPAAAVYIIGAHKARDWMQTPAVRRGTDIVTGLVMTAIAVILLLR